MFGMRIVKSGIAVTISALIAQYFNLSTPFFICITAFISMEKTFLTSLSLGRNRVVGTAIGAIIGAIFASYFPGNAFVAGIGVMLAIKTCTLLKLNGAIFISGIVCIACVLHVDPNNAISYAFSRTIESFLGMMVGILINLLIVPYYDINRLTPMQNNLINNLQSNDLLATQKSLATFENTISLYKDEILTKSKKEKLCNYEHNLNLLKKATLHLEISNDVDGDSIKVYHLTKKEEYLKQLIDISLSK